MTNESNNDKLSFFLSLTSHSRFLYRISYKLLSLSFTFSSSLILKSHPLNSNS